MSFAIVSARCVMVLSFMSERLGVECMILKGACVILLSLQFFCFVNVQLEVVVSVDRLWWNYCH